MAFDWGAEEPPHPTAPDAGERVAAVAEDLPEVHALGIDGWWLATDSPAWAFLPAVWPTAARTWVPDRSTRYMTSGSDTTPFPPFMYDSLESDYNETLAGAALPPRPAGRLWLLRPPPGFATVEDVLDHLCESADEREVDRSCNPAFVAFVEREVTGLFA